MTRGTLQYRVLRAFRRAGIDGDRARGALVHGLRHTFATELANADISAYTLMKLLESWSRPSAMSLPHEPKPAQLQLRTASTDCSERRTKEPLREP